MPRPAWTARRNPCGDAAGGSAHRRYRVDAKPPRRRHQIAPGGRIDRDAVREALRRLEAEGLVEFTRWAGARVPNFDERQLAEAIDGQAPR